MKLSFIILLTLGTAARAVHTNKPEPQPERSFISGAVSKPSPYRYSMFELTDERLIAPCLNLIETADLDEVPAIPLPDCEWMSKHYYPVDELVDVDIQLDKKGHKKAPLPVYLDFKTNEFTKASPSSSQSGGSSEQSQRKPYKKRSSRRKPVSSGNHKKFSVNSLGEKYFDRSRTNALSMNPAGQRPMTAQEAFDKYWGQVSSLESQTAQEAFDKYWNHLSSLESHPVDTDGANHAVRTLADDNGKYMIGDRPSEWDQHSVVDLFWGADQHPANDLDWMADQEVPTQDLRKKREYNADSEPTSPLESDPIDSDDANGDDFWTNMIGDGPSESEQPSDGVNSI